MLPLFLCWSLLLSFPWIPQKIGGRFIVFGSFFWRRFLHLHRFPNGADHPFVSLFVWWLASRKEKFQKRFLGSSLAMLATTFFAALPIGLYF